jgi:hypothetical protein
MSDVLHTPPVNGMDANACLLSAAPDLLEALELCLSDDAGDLEPGTVHKAMEAIRKAKGVQL